MDWREKISRLLQGKNAAQLARSVGLPKNAIRAAVATGQMPRADKAIRIARALSVSSDWLWSDADWPPPASSSGIAFLPDAVILEEALRRKTAARSALDSAVEKYTFIAEQIKRLLQSGGLNPNCMEYWSFRSCLEQLAHSASTYGPMLDVWARIEGIWDARDIIRRPEKAEGVEMDRVISLLEETQDQSRRPNAIRELLSIWGAPQDCIDELQRLVDETIECWSKTRSSPAPVEAGSPTAIADELEKLRTERIEHARLMRKIWLEPKMQALRQRGKDQRHKPATPSRRKK